MKEIKNIILLLLCVFIASCSDDDPVNPELKVLASNVTFTAAGGQGSVQLSHGDAIKAVSDRDWCLVSVEQNVVKIQVAQNDELESRTAGVTITTETEKLIVPVSQEGCILSYKKHELGHVIPYEGGSVSVYLRSNKPYDVVIPEDAKSWLSYKANLTNGTLTFIALPSVDMKPRAAVVKVKAAGKEINYNVGSYAEKDLTGMWGAVYENEEGQQGPVLWRFKKEGNGFYTDTNKGPFGLSEQGIPVPMEFRDGKLFISNGEKVATAVNEQGKELSIWTTVLKHDGGINWDPEYKYVAYPSIFEGRFALVFGSNVDLGYDYIDGFAYWTFNTPNPSFQSSTGYLESFSNLVLFKMQ